MSKFTIFSFIYFIVAAALFSYLESMLMAGELGALFLAAFIYMLISGVWSIINSNTNLFVWVSLIYILLTALLAYDADKNVFWPGREQTIIIAVTGYIIFAGAWLGVKLLKKEFQNK